MNPKIITDKLLVLKAFLAILKQEKKMKKFSGNLDSQTQSQYWEEQKTLSQMLQDFIYFADFHWLTQVQLLNLCRMTGSYRPVALHSFFIYADKQYEKKQAEINKAKEAKKKPVQ